MRTHTHSPCCPSWPLQPHRLPLLPRVADRHLPFGPVDRAARDVTPGGAPAGQHRAAVAPSSASGRAGGLPSCAPAAATVLANKAALEWAARQSAPCPPQLLTPLLQQTNFPSFIGAQDWAPAAAAKLFFDVFLPHLSVLLVDSRLASD